MTTTYFKTSEAMQNTAKYLIENNTAVVSEASVQCNCGETSGMLVYDDDGVTIVEKLVLCTCCHSEASNFERGE